MSDGRRNNGGARIGAGRKPGTKKLAQAIALVKSITSAKFPTDYDTKLDIPMMESLEEYEVRERFRILNEIYGWFKVVVSQGGFPDLVLEDRFGHVVRAEVEVESRHFHAHKHDPLGCDLVIAWKHNWLECPLPVFCVGCEWENYIKLKSVVTLKIELSSRTD